MDKFKAFMTQRVFGIPVLAFVAIMALGVLWYAFKMPPADTGDTTDTGDGTGDATDTIADDAASSVDTSQPVFAATPVIYQNSGISVAATPQEDTNELWGDRVRQWLVGQGATVDMAAGVVSKYLAGQSLTSAETVWRDKAIAQYGFPPENVDYAAPVPDPTKSTPPVASKPTAPAKRQGDPPTVHTVQNTSDNTWAELAMLYYKMDTTDARKLLQAANPRHSPPLAKGERVTIPKWHNPKYYTATSANRSVYKIAGKNGVSAAKVIALNPNTHFPVKVGARVRVE